MTRYSITAPLLSSDAITDPLPVRYRRVEGQVMDAPRQPLQLPPDVAPIGDQFATGLRFQIHDYAARAAAQERRERMVHVAWLAFTVCTVLAGLAMAVLATALWTDLIAAMIADPRVTL